MPRAFILISFRFPPYDRIGAYRWAKLSGRLARRGHKVSVLTVPWQTAADPGWFSDAQHDNITVCRTSSFYPHRLRHVRPSHRLTQKLHGRLLSAFDHLAPEHDAASLWGLSLLPAVERVIARSEARVIVATGAPFSANFWAARIKQKHPGLRVIQDFRDPWLKSEKELANSPWASKFRFATRLADALVTVTPEMSELYARLSGHPRVETIENGVEIEQIRGLSIDVQPRWDFAYIGGLFNQREVPFRLFLEWVRTQKARGMAPKTVVAGLYPHHIASEFRDLIQSGQLELRSLLPQREAFRLVAASRFALQFNGPGALAAVQTTTKLVEHAALLRPTLSLNYGGATDVFIRQRRLGISLRADSPSLFADLDAAFASEQRFDFDVSEFDFDATSERYSKLIDDV